MSAGDSPFNAADPEGFPLSSRERDELAAFEIQDHEGRCGACHTVHPIGSECW